MIMLQELGFHKVAIAKYEKIVRSLPTKDKLPFLMEVAQTLTDRTPVSGIITRQIDRSLPMRQMRYIHKATSLNKMDPYSEQTIENFAIALKNSFRDDTPPMPRSNLAKHERRALVKSPVSQEDIDRYGGNYDLKRYGPEDYVGIMHGGGKRHIEKWLAGNTPGYPLDGHPLERGIQVTPLHKHDPNMRLLVGGTDRTYSSKAHTFLDTPARLTARIKAKYLKPGYSASESQLPTENLKFLERVKVRAVPTAKRLADNPFDHDYASPYNVHEI